MVLEKKSRSISTSVQGRKKEGVRANKVETPTRTELLGKKKVLRVGDICNLKITAVATNNIGIDEYSFPYAVFVPNAKIGSKIKAKILKIKESSYAVAKFLEEKTESSPETLNKVEAPVKPGDVLTVSIEKQLENGKAGIVELANNFRLIIPFAKALTPQSLGRGATIDKETNRLDNVKVTVTRVKQNYGFAKIETSSWTKGAPKNLVDMNRDRKALNSSLEVGSKFTTTLRSSCLKSFRPSGEKGNGQFVVLKISSLAPALAARSSSLFHTAGSGPNEKDEQKTMVLFLKLKKGGSYYQKLATNGELRVRIKITSKSSNCVVGKVLQMNPISKTQKTSLVLNSIREMISHGMHFGEKVVKCNARMKNYIWSVRSKSNVSAMNGYAGASFTNTNGSSGRESIKKPLIKKGRHVINLLKTRRCLNQALKKVTKYALKGRTFLFIGTKKPAAGLVARASFFTKNSFYVNTRWLGGMLTNWKTICKSISKIRPILKEKQKVVRQILERRQAIKNRLIKKALLLRKKSKLILSKGRLLLETLAVGEKSNSSLGEKTNVTLAPSLFGSFATQKGYKDTSAFYRGPGAVRDKLVSLRDEFIHKGMLYVERRQKLIQKRRDLMNQTVLLKEKGLELGLKHQSILNQLAVYAKKLREYKYLLILTTEIQKIRSNNVNLLSVSYGKLKEIIPSSWLCKEKGVASPATGQNLDWIIANPPKEILNRIVVCASKAMKNQAADSGSLSGAQVEQGLTPSFISDKTTSVDAGSPTNGQFVVSSTLLAKFSGFSSYIKSVIKSLMLSILSLEKQAKHYSTQLNQIQNILQTYITLKQTYVNELEQLKLKFIKERSMIRIVKRKLKALEAQKKLLKFLPRLRYLPTPQTKISEIVQILLARIVDPKLKYPIENIYNQKLSMSSKKEAAARKKKWQRLEKYFGGIANMTKLTKTQMGRNIAIIIGQKEEINAVRECQKLGIKMFTVVDTNCNPTFSDHIIPANDDSRSSIKYILTKFITRIRLAQKLRTRLSLYTVK